MHLTRNCCCKLMQIAIEHRQKQPSIQLTSNLKKLNSAQSNVWEFNSIDLFVKYGFEQSDHASVLVEMHVNEIVHQSMLYQLCC